jgi:hypothetical protein
LKSKEGVAHLTPGYSNMIKSGCMIIYQRQSHEKIDIPVKTKLTYTIKISIFKHSFLRSLS